MEDTLKITLVLVQRHSPDPSSHPWSAYPPPRLRSPTALSLFWPLYQMFTSFVSATLSCSITLYLPARQSPCGRHYLEHTSPHLFPSLVGKKKKSLSTHTQWHYEPILSTLPKPSSIIRTPLNPHHPLLPPKPHRHPNPNHATTTVISPYLTPPNLL